MTQRSKRVFTDEWRKNISSNHHDISGKKNPLWRGKNQKDFHRYVFWKKGRAKNYLCSICKKVNSKDWANKDHKYRKVLKDYFPVCRKCHSQYDKKNNNKNFPGRSIPPTKKVLEQLSRRDSLGRFTKNL